ncbi:MAG: GNAT family N-acetyltransferase [Opitutaceae bacterium]
MPPPVTPPAPARDWRLFQGLKGTNRPYQLWQSQEIVDRAWDAFLASTPLGQFQQSCSWAAIKVAEGWASARFIATIDGGVVGGFQVLWRRKRGLKLGYLSKGPVAAEPHLELLAPLLEDAKQVCSHLGLLAAILQLPDLSPSGDTLSTQAGLLPNHLSAIIEASVWIDLDKPFEQIEKGYSKSVRREIRLKEGTPVAVRRGTPDDAGLFFDLMKAACARNGQTPNPASAQSIKDLLVAFAHSTERPDQDAGLLLLEEDHVTIAGILLIRFGSTLILWKKGWTGGGVHINPNKLLNHEAIRWGWERGCKRADLASLSRPLTERLLQPGSSASTPISGSDQYKLLFGGRPVLLPRAFVWIPRWPLRPLYRLHGRIKALRTRLAKKQRASQPTSV